MKVRHGWSGEVAPNRWAKFTVTLEEDDLRRLIREADPRWVNPSSGELDLGTADAFRLLEIEAERLVLAKLITRYGYDDSSGEMSRLAAQRKAVMDRIKHFGDVA